MVLRQNGKMSIIVDLDVFSVAIIENRVDNKGNENSVMEILRFEEGKCTDSASSRGYTATTLGSCTLACLYQDFKFRCVMVSLRCLVLSYGLPSLLS